MEELNIEIILQNLTVYQFVFFSSNGFVRVIPIIVRFVKFKLTTTLATFTPYITNQQDE